MEIDNIKKERKSGLFAPISSFIAFLAATFLMMAMTGLTVSSWTFLNITPEILWSISMILGLIFLVLNFKAIKGSFK